MNENLIQNQKIIHKLSESEIVILLCQTKTENIFLLENFLDELKKGKHKLRLFNKTEENFVFTKDILFIEVCCQKISVHTHTNCFISNQKLYELEKHLPKFFIRISKSTIINMCYMQSLKRERSGIGTIYLEGVPHPLYFSRLYYKNIKEYLDKTN